MRSRTERICTGIFKIPVIFFVSFVKPVDKRALYGQNKQSGLEIANHCIYINGISLEIMRETGDNMNLTEANVGESCIVKDIATEDEELKAFLFRLGCYSGEAITVISRKKSGYTVAIKDGRYNIDSNIAEAIQI